MTLRDRYFVMVTEQAHPRVVAEWLLDPLFARYVARERAKP